MIRRYRFVTLFFPIVGFILFLNLFASIAQEKPKPGWFKLDYGTDSVYGISLNKAERNSLDKKTDSIVIVAVIDGGVDIDHPSLKESLWTNVKEIPNNRIDDDGNGYVDDIHGWNFMASSMGSFQFDNTDLIRQLRQELNKDKHSSKSQELQKEVDFKRATILPALLETKNNIRILNAISSKIGKTYPSEKDLRNYSYQNDAELKALMMFIKGLKTDVNFLQSYSKQYDRYKNELDYLLNIDYFPRSDSNFVVKYRGNNDVKGLDPFHGTCVTGVIASGKPIDGVASGRCKIMVIRAVPNGDLLDADMAMSIKYAVDNGAKIINISAAKSSSPNRRQVDDAVKYAMDKGALIVHAAGNEGIEVQEEYGYPSRNYMDGGRADAWIEVGASGIKNDELLLPWFSNYGKSVDVFAPGVDIYTTDKDNQFSYESGTSVAAPIVSGLAALIWSKYPFLTGLQVKQIILKSVFKPIVQVKSVSGKSFNFVDCSISGGIVNAYDALQLAASDYANGSVQLK